MQNVATIYNFKQAIQRNDSKKKKKRKIQEGIYSFFSIVFFCTFPGETPGDAFKLCHVNRSFLTTRGLNIV